MSSKNDNEERVQKVVFVRHGIALHNLPDSNLSDPKLFDPPLIYQGKKQALHTGHRLQEWCRASSQKEVELVVTSVSTYIYTIQYIHHNSSNNILELNSIWASHI
jgi:bisphosphoglycerate-dependent phosphoglycerate mutase